MPHCRESRWRLNSDTGARARPLSGLPPAGPRRLLHPSSGSLCLCRRPGSSGQDTDLRICAGPDGDRAAPPRRFLKAGDDAIMLKRLIKASAEKHGLIATFMAKPYAQWTGCGMHVHVSLADRGRAKPLCRRRPGDNPLLLNALGGLKAAMAESMLIFAPNANSYRRFRRNSYAPVSAAGASTIAPYRCASRPACPRPATSSTAPQAPTPIPISCWQPCWPVSIMASPSKLDPGPPVTGNGYEQQANRHSRQLV